MITTPPGLYVLSVALLKIIRLNACTVNNLRLVNAFLAIGVFWTAKSIASATKSSFANERALLIAILPNLFIFHGLFYTDTGSVFFYLQAHLALIRRKVWLFLVFAVISILFRQTNSIWVSGFCIADRVHREIGGDLRMLWKRRKLFMKDLMLMLGLCMVFLFGVIVLNRGSIAMGDKDSHTASLHFIQFFYSTTTTLLFCWPILLFDTNLSLKIDILIPFFVMNFVCAAAVKYGTIIHPYLVSDNRHWTNFIWRRLLSRSLIGVPIKFLLVPVHSLAVMAVGVNLKEERGLVWVLGYFATCASVLIPSPLIEPRYYVLPLTLFLLNCKITKKSIVSYQFAVFLAVNAVIVGMFLFRPFVWPHEPMKIQRRIW